ncbi:MAG: hypothetical protein HWD92_02805 [Flavobacteriia bacterium]|nr:hypothetical protein [Flavobacteriia bacterium]
MKKLFARLAEPRKLVVVNSALLVFILALNYFFQAFCVPTTWAAITIAICFLNSALAPLLLETRYKYVSSFIAGISFLLFLYTVVFLGELGHSFGILMILFGIGLGVLVPYFFMAQILWKNLLKTTNSGVKSAFVLGMGCAFTMAFLGTKNYREAVKDIREFQASNYTELNQTFMTEKILGMHFKYHTKYYPYDGWRPPLHEPLLVIGLWSNDLQDPLPVDLKTRVRLYRQFFPDKPVQLNCSCALKGRNAYKKASLFAPHLEHR